MCERLFTLSFVKTLKRNYVHVNPLPDAQTVLRLLVNWIEDYRGRIRRLPGGMSSSARAASISRPG